jgi:hypothetical protein
MLRKICLQSGHENAKNNCDPKLRGSTGAPGEMEFNVRTRNRLSQILLEKKNPDGSSAFTVQLVDATFNCDPNAGKTAYDLFLSIHYDADIYGKGGGFADFPEPSTDHVTKESQRIAKVFNEVYFKHSEIEYVNRSNKNTRYYYMWKFLNAKTPCVLIECGVGQNAHDKVLLADTERIANALARAICEAFGVSFGDELTPEPPEPPADWKAKYEQEVNQHSATKDAFRKYKEDAELAKKEAVRVALDKLNRAVDKAQEDATGSILQ